MGIKSSLGAIREFFKDVMNTGLRPMNDEINRQALEEGLIKPRNEEESYTPAAHCRPDFEPLYQQLTGPNHGAGPA